MKEKPNTSTRQAILDAAVSEFWEHGYRGASVRKICTRAGTSSNAIAYHFGSKEKLYQEILDQFVALQLEHARMALVGELRSPDEFKVRLEMFLMQILGTYLENRESLMIVLREFEQFVPDGEDITIQDPVNINHALSDYIQTAKELGYVREDVDTSIVAGTLLDRLINQARYAHTHKQLFSVTSLDLEYRAYWVRASLGLILDGMKPRA